MNGAAVLPIQEFSLPYQKTAGCLLREARELKGLSQESVASTLNLMTSHVVAMESDSYNPHLEGKYFAAYLKSYARLVELNPQILLGLYQGQAFVQSQSQVQKAVAHSKPQSTGMSLRIVTVVALLGIALMFTRQGIGVQQLSEKGQQWAAQLIQANIIGSPFFAGKEHPPENIDSALASEGVWRVLEADYAEQELASVAANDKSQLASQASPGAFHQPMDTISQEGEGTTAAEKPSNIIITPSDATYQAYRLDVLESTPSAVGAISEDVLQFTFVENCWVEVYDSQQNPIVMETKLEGELLNISGQAPFEVRVGNSRAVSLLLNGEPVHIERHPTIDSTELIVGQR